MSDVFNKTFRSEVMKSVKSKGNRSTELRLIEFFKMNGIKGWRRNYKLVGKPDFVFLKQKVAVFADGCFWHGHYCRNIIPKQNKAYWERKRERNKLRDRLVNLQLKSQNWVVIRLWECEIKNELVQKKLLKKLMPRIT
jgi:DNA mismatch endonuclease (patch repair protein)